MKRWLIWILSLLLIGVAAIAIKHYQAVRDEEKRQALYQSVLASYSARFKPGATRKEVEDYFRAGNINFRTMCCADPFATKRVPDDLVKIGPEPTPFFCTEKNAYIAFQFNGENPTDQTISQAKDADPLTSIIIFHMKQGCL